MGTWACATFPLITEQDADRGFEIRDRRRRPEEVELPRADQKIGPERPAGSEPAAAAERSLVGLFLMLGGFAMAALEGVQDPETGQLVRDPRQAAELIDTLMLLRQKTEGHRTPDESKTLDDLIYDLQLRYVGRTTSS